MFMVQQSFRLIGMFYYVDWWNAQHFPDKSTWVGVGLADLPMDLPIQDMDYSTFSNKKSTYPKFGKVNLFLQQTD